MGDSSAGDEAVAVPLAPSWRLRPRAPAAERDLIRSAQAGSADALGEIARRSWPDAYRAALVIVRDRSAAEDIAQDAILAAIDGLHRFNPRRPFAPWLQRIVAHKAMDHVRKATRRARIEATLDPPGPAPAQPGLSDEMMAALLSLSLEERAAVVLRHLAGLSSREIARVIGSKPATVRSMLRRARARLASALGDPPERGTA